MFSLFPGSGRPGLRRDRVCRFSLGAGGFRFPLTPSFRLLFPRGAVPFNVAGFAQSIPVPHRPVFHIFRVQSRPSNPGFSSTVEFANHSPTIFSAVLSCHDSVPFSIIEVRRCYWMQLLKKYPMSLATSFMSSEKVDSTRSASSFSIRKRLVRMPMLLSLVRPRQPKI